MRSFLGLILAVTLAFASVCHCSTGGTRLFKRCYSKFEKNGSLEEPKDRGLHELAGSYQPEVLSPPHNGTGKSKAHREPKSLHKKRQNKAGRRYRK